MALNIKASDEPKMPPPAPGTVRQTPTASRPKGPEPKPASTKSSIKMASESEIRKWLEKSYVTIGMGVVAFRPRVGSQILVSAEKCAESVAKLAMENDSVRRAISALMVTSVWGGVIAAHLPILLVIAAEYRTTDENVQFNQQTLLGFAAMMSGEDVVEDDE